MPALRRGDDSLKFDGPGISETRTGREEDKDQSVNGEQHLLNQGRGGREVNSKQPLLQWKTAKNVMGNTEFQDDNVGFVENSQLQVQSAENDIGTLQGGLKNLAPLGANVVVQSKSILQATDMDQVEDMEIGQVNKANNFVFKATNVSSNSGGGGSNSKKWKRTARASATMEGGKNSHAAKISDFRTVVMDAWSGGNVSSLEQLLGKIKNCSREFAGWNNRVYGYLGIRMEKVKKELADCYHLPRDAAASTKLDALLDELAELEKCQEIYWRQRAKMLWLKEGDRNTAFFHSFASQRKRDNRIARIKDENGNLKVNPGELENIFIGYFEKLFSTSHNAVPEGFSDVIKTRLTSDQIDILSKPWSPMEVKAAIDQMNPSKAPGPDGMTAMFYQKYWDVVGKDVTTSVL
ncbi:hypothetical protein COLO4_25383 [Corchorus olitorius]|uniref:Reverse transcriptase n=1 Tax=Corchorus olitorius TaxID=93759 RepID=A0A1R3I383_9ROSI|nr:hypothetical protein COLO4_25383 [Corchorus olitorius]